jgi:hypothetical protein
MDPKELRGLLEAYSEVYTPQEEIEEAVKGESSERRMDLAAERRAGHRPKSAKEGENYASHKLSQMAYVKRKRMGEEVEEVEEATAMAKRGYDEAPIRQKIAKSTGGGEAADRATALADKQVFRGSGSTRDNLARKQRGDFRKTTSSSPGLHGYAHKSDDSSVKAKQAARGAQRGVLTPAEKKRLNREEVKIFDVVLEFLQAEGFAETLEEAEKMMANVLNAEAINIILGEAQEARNNPEKYEREQSKKSAPVRGEKTPMPPRGDKRREDFEKWYAANVR